MTNDTGLLLIISGPSGVGKSTVIKEMMKQDVGCHCYFSVSMTTRVPRGSEVEGVHYHFVSEQYFLETMQAGLFLEHAKYNQNYYGTPMPPIQDCINEGGCAILDIDVQGMLQVREKVQRCATVFMTPPDFTSLENRLRERKTETEEHIQCRLAIAKSEFEQANLYDYMIVNDDIQTAAKDLAAIIRAEKLRILR